MEPAGIEWPARRRLYDRLRQSGHTPWLYEEEGEKSVASGEYPKDAITRAIEGADVVVMFFKSRSGSNFLDAPFRGTDYEYWEARRLGIPVYLYLIGHLREPSLNATLSIISDPLLLMRAVRSVESDGDELAQAVVLDLKREIDIRSRSIGEELSHENRLALVDLDRSWLEQELNMLQVSASQNLWSAAKLANRIPIHLPTAQSRFDPSLSQLYAGVLDVCGGILGNQWRYDEAIQAKKLSIRYFAQSGATSVPLHK